MRNYTLYTIIGFLLLASACTKNFEQINTDPKRYSPANFDANYFLSSSQRNYITATSGYSGPILFQSGWVQIFSMATVTGDYYNNADKYVASSNTNAYVERSWNDGYRSAALANEILINKGKDADWANVNAVASVMKVLNFLYITDIYGDAPYTEALKVREGNTLPVYDAQQVIYNGLLKDLETAVAGFNTSKPKAIADISSLGGDVAKWKRFANSLMLKIAMRLTKKDLATAKMWAEKAYAGGTLQPGEDVYFKNDEANGYSNPNISAWLTATDFYQVRWSKTLIDYLKGTADPRLSMVAEVPQAGYAANNNKALPGDNTAANQVGQPNGYDLASIASSPGYPGATGTGTDITPIGKYSRPAINIYSNRSLPLMVMTYAESELLLAEAAARTWSVGATAAMHYKNGLAGAITALNAFKSGVADATTAEAYATANPLDVSSTANSLAMINTQYWATTGILFNFSEAWTNWRRSGYPALTAINYAGNFSNGSIPRRQPYPSNESSNNPDNYKAAVAKLTGGDLWTARVWWDAQ